MAPANTPTGRMFFDTAIAKMRYWDGGAWRTVQDTDSGGVSGLPLGSVIPTFPHLAGAYSCANKANAGADALGFVLCSGIEAERTINDGGSLMNGAIVPLINDDVFLMGSVGPTDSVQTGANVVNLQHTHTCTTELAHATAIPAHTHDLGNNGGACIYIEWLMGTHFYSAIYESTAVTFNPDASHRWDFNGGAYGDPGAGARAMPRLAGRTEAMTAGSGTLDLDHAHTLGNSLDAAFDKRPKYMKAIYVMRIK